ncbi:hypothetical protein K1719_004161 [Acacia pycnantha]|nr:hypothetical protein K1719_004161 [Acacia pycnantha]
MSTSHDKVIKASSSTHRKWTLRIKPHLCVGIRVWVRQKLKQTGNQTNNQQDTSGTKFFLCASCWMGLLTKEKGSLIHRNFANTTILRSFNYVLAVIYSMTVYDISTHLKPSLGKKVIFNKDACHLEFLATY